MRIDLATPKHIKHVKWITENFHLSTRMYIGIEESINVDLAFISYKKYYRINAKHLSWSYVSPTFLIKLNKQFFENILQINFHDFWWLFIKDFFMISCLRAKKTGYIKLKLITIGIFWQNLLPQLLEFTSFLVLLAKFNINARNK